MTTSYSLSHWQVNPDSNELVNKDSNERVELDATSQALLMFLIDSDGDVVSREDIASVIWPNESVENTLITKAVSQLRSALGDDSRSPTFIKTVPKKGYQLLVKAEKSAKSAAKKAKAAAEDKNAKPVTTAKAESAPKKADEVKQDNSAEATAKVEPPVEPDAKVAPVQAAAATVEAEKSASTAKVAESIKPEPANEPKAASQLNPKTIVIAIVIVLVAILIMNS